MYAVIAHGGKQYRVSPGERVRLEKMAGEAGALVEFTSLLLVERDGELRAGAAVAGAKVTAKIVRQDRGPKIVVFKKKRRKQYRRTRGHRQDFTEVHIEQIV